MAALAAAKTGARVVLADEQNEFGGSLLASRETIDGKPASSWVCDTIEELKRFPEVRLLPRTTVTGYYDHNYLIMAERRTDHLPRGSAPKISRQRLWKVRAKQVVLATGAHERPLVFADNDRPGVMLADAARTYANRFGTLPGKRAVVLTNNDSAYRAALDLADAGVGIAAIVDLRTQLGGPLVAEAKRRGIRILTNSAVTATYGAKRVTGVDVMTINGSGESVIGAPTEIDCDLVLMSGGWNPAVHLFSQSTGKLRYDDALACFVPNISMQAERSAGSCKATFTLAGCLAEGAAAGAEGAKAGGQCAGGRGGGTRARKGGTKGPGKIPPRPHRPGHRAAAADPPALGSAVNHSGRP